MFRDKIRAARRLNTSSSGNSINSFAQAAILVLLGSFITFWTTFGNSYLTKIDDNKKAIKEKRRQFEQEVDHSISASFSAVRRLVLVGAEDSVNDKRLDMLDSSQSPEYLNNNFNLVLQMPSYVDSVFAVKLDEIYDDIRRLDNDARYQRNYRKNYTEFVRRENSSYSFMNLYESDIKLYVRGFHEAIEKGD